eukprot:UN20522
MMLLTHSEEMSLRTNTEKCTFQATMALMRTKSWTTSSPDTPRKEELHLATRPAKAPHEG